MQNLDHNLRRDNLRKQIANTGLTHSEFALRAGVSRSYLSQLLSAGFRFGEKAARTLEAKLHLPRGLLDEDESVMSSQIEVWEVTDDLPKDAFAMVQRITIKTPASGIVRVEESMDLPPLAFRKDWLQKKNVTSRSNLRVLEMQGDSMAEHLQDGDMLMIDKGQTQLVDNEVYAIVYAGEVRIRRLSRRFDGGLIIRSDNAKYPDEALGPEDAAQIEVIGRMLWRGG